MSEDSQISTFYSGPLTPISFKDKGVTRYYVEGYLSTDELDMVNDVVTDNCMESMLKQLQSRSIKMDFQHDNFRGTTFTDKELNKTLIPLGKNIEGDIDEGGLKHRTELNPNWVKFDSKGDVAMTFEQLWSSVKDNFYDAFSIAYVPTKIAYVTREGKQIRLLDDVKLLNYALTGNPVNTGATMTTAFAKSLDAMTESSNEGGTLTEEEITEEENPEVQEPEVKDVQEQVNELKATIETLQEEKTEQLREEVKSILDEMSPEDLKSLIDKHSQDEEGELKSLTAEVEALKTQVDEQKSIIEEARHKAKGSEAKSADETFNPTGGVVGGEMKSPLDVVQ